MELRISPNLKSDKTNLLKKKNLVLGVYGPKGQKYPQNHIFEFAHSFYQERFVEIFS